MIKSRHNTSGFWILVGGMILFSFLIVCSFSQYYFHYTIIRIDINDQRSFNAQVILCLIGCLTLGIILSSRASNIEIYSDGIKTISFTNLFTRRRIVYSFQEFDSYIRTRLWHKQWNENKTLCLIKDGRVIMKIDNFFYSNIDELQEGLNEMPYLGFKNMGIVNTWKVMFNKPIL